MTILASGTGWHVQDLLRAAATRSIDASLSDFRRLSQWVGDGYCAKPPRRIVLVRTMPPGSLEQIVFRMDTLHVAESNGSSVFNPPRALETCIDKFLTTQRLEAAVVPVPKTWSGQLAEYALPAFEQLGGDVVVKPLFGSEGRGLIRVTDTETAWRVFTAIERTAGVIYQQEFVQHPGHDLRVFVLGDRVLAAMRRHAIQGWRTNVAQGARTESVQISEVEERLALAAAAAVGCPIAGVDLLSGPNGNVVIEVNGVPGWRALSATCKIDVAGAILDFVAERVRT